MAETTSLQAARLRYKPTLPAVFGALETLTIQDALSSSSVAPDIASLFPLTAQQKTIAFQFRGSPNHRCLRVGVLFSGGQASGGHNVIAGLYDALTRLHSDSKLFGFLGGPSGIVDNDTIEITDACVAAFRNQGGFDMIGSGRTKIETPAQFHAAKEAVEALQLDGLVIIGGDDSNTNAALLAEYFRSEGSPLAVVGVPKTIDGDLKSDDIEVSFGFDTACKVYSDLIGNIARDCLSAKKYYYFIKLMGRSASHITLECALQTHPNYAFIGEEVAEQGTTFAALVTELCDVISKRADGGKNYGVVLIPEGIIEFVPEFRTLIQELNTIVAKDSSCDVIAGLSEASQRCYSSLPPPIQQQLLMDRDPHGNVQVSKIETERLFIAAVKEELGKRKKAGKYRGTFSAQPLFCGYEGRSALPSNFDSTYCYALGHVAALLASHGATGYMSCVGNLTQEATEWTIAGIPSTSMLTIEKRQGKKKPVIQKAFVALDGAPFSLFQQQRARWAMEDDYRYPGPIQFFGAADVTDATTMTLQLERSETSTLVQR